MAVDPRKRQKKLERKRAKQKAKRRELARRQQAGIAGKLQYAARFPVLHSLAAADLWDQGIGEVLLSRELNNGTVAVAVFLVDVYCLGVKDVIMNVLAREQYEEFFNSLCSEFELAPIAPQAARQLVEGAVEYADKLGLPPAHEYRKARLIFGDIDASACCEQFEYGYKGKPLFIPGPYDDPAKCQYVLTVLMERCGPDGFRFAVPIDAEAQDTSEGAVYAVLGSSSSEPIRSRKRAPLGWLDDEDSGDFDRW